MCLLHSSLIAPSKEWTDEYKWQWKQLTTFPSLLLMLCCVPCLESLPHQLQLPGISLPPGEKQFSVNRNISCEIVLESKNRKKYFLVRWNQYLCFYSQESHSITYLKWASYVERDSPSWKESFILFGDESIEHIRILLAPFLKKG